jgi:hypothetical protein
MKLEKLTLDYVAAEDRILLRAQDQSGTVVTFWLTLRMSRALVKALLAYLENVTPTRATSDRELMQAFRQTSALMKFEPSAVVQTTDAAPLLVTTLDLQRKPKGVLLQLPIPDADMAELALDSVQLRQYLHILRNMFVRAEWPLDDWPAWMNEAAAEVTGAERNARPLH